jgi:molybdopterin molybdotransferase
VIEAARAGRHIRRMGQDFAAGDEVLPQGRRLGARDVGLAAAANHPFLAVHRRPVIAILSTGDEIAMPGEPIPPGGVVSSNALALAALVRAAGGEPLVLPVVRDDVEAIGLAADAARRSDMLVTTGGASVGDHDLIVPGLRSRGLELDFWKIAMRPGKPLMHGRMGEVSVLGLPGNPVSALICGVLFLLPALDRLCGRVPSPLPSSPAMLGAAVPENDRRADHLRATLRLDDEGTLIATPFPVQDSGLLRRLAAADALILRAPHAPALPAGSPVRIVRLDVLGI